MLNEKEKKAIERLKERINDNEDYKTVQVWLTADIVAVNTVLNLITKLQKENKDLKTTINKQSLDISNNLLELQQKDKQINLMAEWIFDKDYGKNSLLIHRDDYYSNCIKQVRQYFETKVKGK